MYVCLFVCLYVCVCMYVCYAMLCYAMLYYFVVSIIVIFFLHVFSFVSFIYYYYTSLFLAPKYNHNPQWQFVHMASGTATGILSMQALLFAVGAGAGAVPMAAAVNWILKDGLGQVWRSSGVWVSRCTAFCASTCMGISFDSLCFLLFLSLTFFSLTLAWWRAVRQSFWQ